MTIPAIAPPLKLPEPRSGGVGPGVTGALTDAETK